jgi:hypothetical protein
MVVPMVIILAFGLNLIVKYKKIVPIIGLVYLASIIYFIDAYFIHLPAHNSQYWDYGYKQIVETITPIQKNYKFIKVQQSYAQPYIFFLFYQKYDPAKYQQKAVLVESPYGDVGQVYRLDNILFAPIDWSRNRGEHGVLFAADSMRIPPDDSKDQNLFRTISDIKYLDGHTAFRVLEVK